MKATFTVAAILVSGLLQTCKPEEPKVYIPGIETVSFKDLLQENIQFDALNRVITVVLPATVTTLKLQPTFQLTPDTKIVGGLLPDGTLDLSTYCPCYRTNNVTVGFTTANQLETTYQIRLKAKAPLLIKPSTSPLIYSISDKSVNGVVVPVENYYGSESVRRIKLINTDTGRSAYTSGDGSCLSDCSSVGLNRMSIPLNFFLRDFDYGFGPGSYIVEFILNDGTVIKTPQAIQVVP